MHDFILAKEIIDELKKIIVEKNIKKAIKSVNLEIGTVSLAHDGHPEHTEDITLENLEFGLRSIAKGTSYENVQFNIEKVFGENWRITNIEVE